jgi:hypothetical protein
MISAAADCSNPIRDWLEANYFHLLSRSMEEIGALVLAVG